MADYVFSVEADADIHGIWRYSAINFGAGQADTYTDQLLRSVQTAARFPFTGRDYTTRSGRPYKQYNCGRHAIFYRSTEAGIFVVRVLHLMMDFDRHLDGL